MPDQFATRVLRALLAVWFVLSVGEPSVVRVCPMHASAAAELADAGFDHAPRGSGHAAHHAADHHAGHGASSHSQSSGEHQHHCTCINCCVGSASAALQAPRVQLEPAMVVAVPTQTVARGTLPRRDDPPHLLPPGTGPPRV